MILKEIILFQILLIFSFLVYPQTEAKSDSNPLDNLIVVEAENCIVQDGKNVYVVKNENASGQFFISSYPSPFRVFQKLAEQVIVETEIKIPVSGIWYLHVRYFVTPENIRKLLSSQKPPSHFRYFAPFKIIIGGNELICGSDQSAGQEFRLDTFKVNLSSGKIPVKFVMNDLSGIDCIILTRVSDYKPEPSDYQGPLWFRFKVVKGPDVPFYIFYRINFNPYESKIPVTGWIFKDTFTTSSEQMQNFLKEGNLLKINEWTPWIKTINPKRAFCSMHVMVMPQDFKKFPDTRREGFNNIEVIFQACTRPDENFLIHQGIESSGPVRGIYILLPHEPGLEGMRKWTKSFSEWADERLAFIKQIKNEPISPEKIQIFTDARATVEKDIDSIIESCKLAGFNGFDLDQKIIDETILWQKIKDAGFSWTVAHHLMLINPDWKEITRISGEKKNIQEVINQYWYEKIKERILKLWGARPEIKRKMLDLAILADEPVPQPHYLMINFIPPLRESFHQYLRNHGLNPEFFGKKHWDEIDAFGFSTGASSSLKKLLEDFGIELEWVKTDGKEDEEVAATQVNDNEESTKKDEGKKNLKNVQVAVREKLTDATVYEKRLYYWTQKFRSYYTQQIYHQGTKVVRELSENGWLKKDIKISPNFQAAPMMETRMWDGALNLFEWARNNTTNFLLCEDWINDPYRVSFGFALLNAAARKNHQQLGYLIVVDRNFRRRYLTGLAMGVKTFIDYSYGPLFTKGPAWASSPEYAKNWCEMLDWTSKCENDIVESRLRPADAAILIANSSEINSAFYSATNFETELAGGAYRTRALFRRAGLYTCLLDGNIPVEIISEEEIMEDNILDRFKVLYVVDTHVKTEVQEKIKQWVKNGGTLWADYIALARNEYDENSDIMNDVFGLSSRGQLPDMKKGPEKQAKGEKINIIQTEYLDEVSFTGSLFKPQWEISTGKPIAVFDDGSPAAVYNKFGKGNAIIVGCSALTFSSYNNQYKNHPDFDKVRKLVFYPFEISSGRKHCIINVPKINAFVRDNSDSTVVFLINSTGKKQSNIEIKLFVPAEIVSASDASGGSIQFIQKNNEVFFNRSIEENDADICIFRFVRQ